MKHVILPAFLLLSVMKKAMQRAVRLSQCIHAENGLRERANSYAPGALSILVSGHVVRGNILLYKGEHIHR